MLQSNTGCSIKSASLQNAVMETYCCTEIHIKCGQLSFQWTLKMALQTLCYNCRDIEVFRVIIFNAAPCKQLWMVVIIFCFPADCSISVYIYLYIRLQRMWFWWPRWCVRPYVTTEFCCFQLLFTYAMFVFHFVRLRVSINPRCRYVGLIDSASV